MQQRQQSAPWRVYVGEDIPESSLSPSAEEATSPLDASERGQLLDTAFLRRAAYALHHTPLRYRQQPSSAPSPVLRWLLLYQQQPQQAKKDDVGQGPPEGVATRGLVAPASPTTAAATSALARRGVGVKDPLLQRLAKKKKEAVDRGAKDDRDEHHHQVVLSRSHWTQHRLSAMTHTSWRVFRQQLGITLELRAAPATDHPSTPATAASSLSVPPPSPVVSQAPLGNLERPAEHAGASPAAFLPAAESLPAIRCWEEARLPLSLGRCIARLYALPTAVQAQCVPVALLLRPPSVSSPAPPATPTAPATAAAVRASELGMDILAVAETGSGKTAAYLVPLLYHVLCRAPRLLGYPDRISLGPLSMVMVPTRELAEQVTASLYQMCGRDPSTRATGERLPSRAELDAWEALEMTEEAAGINETEHPISLPSATATAPTANVAASAQRNHLSQLRVVKVVGGESREAQYAALAQGAHCVVGTVGQLHALLQDRLLSLGNTQFVVMDEADRMIDEQQEERLTAVLERCPQPRQTLLVTATLSAACATVAKRYLSRHGYYLVRTPYRCASIRQSFELVADSATPASGEVGAGVAASADSAAAARTRPPSRSVRPTEAGDPSEGSSPPPPDQRQQQQQQRPLHPLLHPQKFFRLVTWLVYGTGPIIVFANERTTCDVLWEELRAEAEFLDAQQEWYTIEDLVGPPPDGLTFREELSESSPSSASPTSATATAQAGAAAAQRLFSPTLLNLTSVAVVHSELSQSERRSLVERFAKRQRHVLITTDLLARGLDVAGVTLVVNYDVPWTIDAGPGAASDAVLQYIHRIGRTGRAGSTGVAVTFVTLPAAMVQRAEEVAREEEQGVAPRSRDGGDAHNGGPRIPVSVTKRGEGDVEDDMAVLGELFDGDTKNVWMAGVSASVVSHNKRRREGEDSDDDEEAEGTQMHGEDGRGEAGDTERTTTNSKPRRGAPQRQQRSRKTCSALANDVAVLRPLWSFLVECAEGEGCRDGAVALRRGRYAKISIPRALACIMAQLSATSQDGCDTIAYDSTTYTHTKQTSTLLDRVTMLCKHIGNIEEKADRVLQRIRDDVCRREDALREIRLSLHTESESDARLREIFDVQHRLMPQYVRRSAALARVVSTNAVSAERSSKRVRRLDAVLQRVQETSAIVDAMRAMEEDAAQVPATLESGDIEKTVQLLHSWEEAQRVLTSTASATLPATTDAAHEARCVEEGAQPLSSSSFSSHPAASPMPQGTVVHAAMRDARQQVRTRLLAMLEDAIRVNDKLTVMKLARLLAELGEGAMAARMYSGWIADHTIATLSKLIGSEMKKRAEPGTAALSHLALVSQCLDNVAAAFEGDEEFTQDAFGAQGPLTLLTELHSRATERCVPVLSDFMEQRKGVLTQLEKHVSDGERTGPASTESSAPVDPARGYDVNAVVVSARRADQVLEEIAHMVSCGHVYLSFVQRKQREYRELLNSPAAGSKSNAGDKQSVGADALWQSRDNALLNALQDILALYVPLQNAYFIIAYHQAVDLQLHAIRDAAKKAAATAAAGGGKMAATSPAGSVHVGHGAGGGERRGPAVGERVEGHRAAPISAITAAAPSGFLAGLQNFYTVAASSAEELIATVGGGSGFGDATSTTTTTTSATGDAGAAAAELASYWYFTHNGQVTLPDDVFFVLRLAMHRALNTKSAQICSAVIMSAMDVVQARLLPEIESHTTVASSDNRRNPSASPTSPAPSEGGATAAARRRRAAAASGGFLTPDELHWTGAAHQTATYLQRLAGELQELSETTFATTPRDVVRFRELASNMRSVGTDLLERWIPAWLDAFAGVCCDGLLPPHMGHLAAVLYDMKEDMYSHYELNDAWVQACLMDLSAGLQYLHQHLTEAKLFDMLLAAMARRVAKATSDVLLRKRFSLFGALQVDKDVRALRNFFVERVQDDLTPVRAAFSKLGLMVTLLLSDKPTDALEEALNPALTAEEKKQVLLTRVEFHKEAIMTLPL